MTAAPERVSRRRFILASMLVAGSAVGAGVGVLLHQRGRPSDPAPTRPAVSLGPRTPRLAYVSGDRLFILPVGGVPLEVASLVEMRTPRPQVDYLKQLVWSPDGRYLAWRQQLFDDPGYEDFLRPDRSHGLTIMDTRTGARRSWWDDQESDFDTMPPRAFFVDDALVTFAGGNLYRYREPGTAPSTIGVSDVAAFEPIGSVPQGLLFSVPTEARATDVRLVALDGSSRSLGILTVPDPIVHTDVDPAGTRIAVVTAKTWRACPSGHAGGTGFRIFLTTRLAAGLHEIAVPPQPSGRAVTLEARFSTAGTFLARLTPLNDDCYPDDGRAVALHQVGDRLQPDARLIGLHLTTSPFLTGFPWDECGSHGELATATGTEQQSLQVTDAAGRQSRFSLPEVGPFWACA